MLYLQTHVHVQNYLNIKQGICIKTENLNFKRNSSQVNSILDLSITNNSFSTIPSFLVKGLVDHKTKKYKTTVKEPKEVFTKMNKNEEQFTTNKQKCIEILVSCNSKKNMFPVVRKRLQIII